MDAVTSALFRRAAFWCALLIPFVLIGFWPTCWTKLSDQADLRLI